MRFAPTLPVPTMLAAVLLAAGPVAGAAGAPTPAGKVVIEQNDLGPDGWPVLIADFQNQRENDVKPSWSICAPGCGAPVAQTDDFEPGPTGPGTIFEASTTVGGITTTARSKTWLGRVSSATPPSMSGTAVIGSTVQAHPGTWTGGWGDEFSLYGLRACATPVGTGCRAVQGSVFDGEYKPTPITLTTAYGGWYIGAVESRYADEAAFAGVGTTFAPNVVAGYPAPDAAQTVSVGPLVQVPAASAAQLRAAKVRVVVRRHARRVGRSLVIGTIRCPEGCVASAVMIQDDEHYSGGGDVRVEAGGTHVIQVSLRTFTPGRTVHVTARASGARTVSARVSIPR